VAWLRESLSIRYSLRPVLAEFLWVLILFLSGLIAARYVERSDNRPVCWLFYGAGAITLSFVRAYLFSRYREEARRRTRPPTTAPTRATASQLNYVLFASVLYLGLALLAGWYVAPVLFLPLAIGALLPGLDRPQSWLGKLLPFVSHDLEARFGQQHALHTLAALTVLATLTLPLAPIMGWAAWAIFLFGYSSHLALDLFMPPGIALLWPVSQKRFSILRRSSVAPGSRSEQWLSLVLAVSGLAVLFAVDIGQPPPPPAPVPSYSETLEQYYELRGRNQAIASVEGTWQATGRRITDRFEVLNARGESFVMLDRFTGKVFAAGRGADDNLYLNRIRLQVGPPVRIQAVELHLQDEPLAEALPDVYQMEREPGLQHIYVSGDVVLRPRADNAPPSLSSSHAQTTMRHVQRVNGDPIAEHYRLQYLTAAELIQLAQLEVKSADLVIVATYVQDAPSPTPTPLPSPPAPQSTIGAGP
jgi:inner membrane protein